MPILNTELDDTNQIVTFALRCSSQQRHSRGTELKNSTYMEKKMEVWKSHGMQGGFYLFFGGGGGGFTIPGIATPIMTTKRDKP